MINVTRRAALAAAGLLAGAGAARADTPSKLSVSETVDIARTPDQVWAMVQSFDSIAVWHPAVATSPASKGNAVGSRRTLTLRAPGDPHFDEELLGYDMAGRSYQYRIVSVDPAVLPVTDYEANFAVMANPGGGSTVVWDATFKRASPASEPPAAMSDRAAITAITGVFRGGLDNIKKLAES